MQANFGICMDLNPHRFTAPWDAYEFASHALSSGSEMLVLSMAWLTRLDDLELAAHAGEPDWSTWSYWLARLEPFLKAEKDVIAVFGNRCGAETGPNPLGGEEGVRYAGSSWIGSVGDGAVRVWEIMGRAEEGVLVADTHEEPKWSFRPRRQSDEEGEEEQDDDDEDDDEDGNTDEHDR